MARTTGQTITPARLERMFGKIESIEGTDNMSTLAAIRRLHPRLPAFTAEFTQSVPLTRIRDIAHGKGDEHGKCREVRQEIKHTIQNKLHRCAGPEDLVASEKMLQNSPHLGRITRKRSWMSLKYSTEN